ncbi:MULTISPECIES: hypothetical protein [Furfurilactobacillus]|uniref:Uncharacterized protein n=1 Tax=Furfurilactobacillus rossiae TaxID=231049 RepID=A0A7C9N8S9_9LACO|nr:hypothetical protein [Furfurilactobacillus milii]MYV04770.1 hypothetical protein [Furfurilactobacillus milii]
MAAVTMTDADWQDYLNKTPRAIRAVSLLTDQWQSVLVDNPLFISMISIADLVYANRLAVNEVQPNVEWPLDTYAHRQQFRRHYARYLTPDSNTWLKRED